MTTLDQRQILILRLHDHYQGYITDIFVQPTNSNAHSLRGPLSWFVELVSPLFSALLNAYLVADLDLELVQAFARYEDAEDFSSLLAADLPCGNQGAPSEFQVKCFLSAGLVMGEIPVDLDFCTGSVPTLGANHPIILCYLALC